MHKVQKFKVANFFLGRSARAARAGKTNTPSIQPRQRPPTIIADRQLHSRAGSRVVLAYDAHLHIWRSRTILQVNNSSMVMHPINSSLIQPMSAISGGMFCGRCAVTTPAMFPRGEVCSSAIWHPSILDATRSLSVCMGGIIYVESPPKLTCLM